jgi:hypothetical protein
MNGLLLEREGGVSTVEFVLRWPDIRILYYYFATYSWKFAMIAFSFSTVIFINMPIAI